MLRKRGARPRPRAISSATSTSNPTTRSGWAGSASTNGAPPSGSAAQTKSRAVCGAANSGAAAETASAQQNAYRSLKVAPGKSVRHRVQHDVHADRVAGWRELFEVLAVLALALPGVGDVRIVRHD